MHSELATLTIYAIILLQCLYIYSSVVKTGISKPSRDAFHVHYKIQLKYLTLEFPASQELWVRQTEDGRSLI